MNEHSPSFPILDADVPWLTTKQMIEVDRAMIEEYRIELIQMMENAGRSLALVAKRRFLSHGTLRSRIAVLAGTGGNGGGAMVAARRLASWGAEVRVYVTAGDERMTPVPKHQLEILRRMGIAIETSADLHEGTADLIIDGVIGYSLKGDPKGPAAAMIGWATANPAPTLALDVPSGVDTATGQVFAPAVVADATLTLALPKEGLRSPGVEAHVGELYLADIGVPPELYASLNLNLEVPPIFATSDVLRIR